MEPQTSPKLTPKFFFLSLGVIISLITSVVAFINVVFETLTFKFPDALNGVYQYGYSTYSYEGIRSALATLIIIFPIFLVLAYFWRKVTKEGLSKNDTIVRRWMIYLILFLTTIVIAVDLVTLVRYFVGGEITTRFILKVVAVLVTAKLVGWNYLSELSVDFMKGLQRVFTPFVNAIIATVLILTMLIWSFMVIGSPAKQRAWRLDDRRVQDLTSIQWQVINMWQQKEKLPETIKDLSNPISNYMVPVDPEVEKGRVYEYKKTGELTFELCATFSQPMPKGWMEYGNGGGGIRPMYSESGVSTDMAYPYPGPGGASDSWDHQAGRTCFERTIDKDLYPPYPKPEMVK